MTTRLDAGFETLLLVGSFAVTPLEPAQADGQPAWSESAAYEDEPLLEAEGRSKD